MKCLWQVENDPYCLKVLAKHWPDVRRYSDVKDITELEYVDLIAGGFPCQPVSVAGARKGTEDERWLWPEFLRILRMVRPRFVLVENVPGLLSINRGTVFGGILGDLAESGYDAEWGCLSAASVGAPHRRDRVFIVAHTRSERNNRRAGQCGNPQAARTCYQSIGSSEHTKYVADSSLRRRYAISTPEPQKHQGRESRGQTGRCCSTISVSPEQGLEGSKSAVQPREYKRLPPECDWWAPEPDVGRVAYGIPDRVDRLRGLGNAVVPQVAEYIGRQIMRDGSAEIAAGSYGFG